MKTRAEMLAWRRQLLIAESNMQRAELAMQVQPIVYTLASVNIGMRILGRVRQHPGWLATVALGVLAIRPHRISSFLRLGTASLRLLRHAAPLLQSAPPASPPVAIVSGPHYADISLAEPRAQALPAARRGKPG